MSRLKELRLNAEVAVVRKDRSRETVDVTDAFRAVFAQPAVSRGGFVSAAVRAQVPIIPVSIVGSEEIYPLISSAPVLARALGVPYFPITPLFPWFGLLGLVPLPSKWVIEFGEAVTTDELPPGAEDRLGAQTAEAHSCGDDESGRERGQESRSPWVRHCTVDKNG